MTPCSTNCVALVIAVSTFPIGRWANVVRHQICLRDKGSMVLLVSCMKGQVSVHITLPIQLLARDGKHPAIRLTEAGRMWNCSATQTTLVGALMHSALLHTSFSQRRAAEPFTAIKKGKAAIQHATGGPQIIMRRCLQNKTPLLFLFFKEAVPIFLVSKGTIRPFLLVLQTSP